MKPRAAQGSSPLARGLPLRLAVDGGDVGIIPARAGFTQLPVGVGQGPQDHPRSRGVYLWELDPEYGRVGSSPLARGLPHAGTLRPGAPGIIPARAGFTRPPRARRRPGRDHPRSRGVYSTTPTSSSPSLGSSPLARGLPLPGGDYGCDIRIIPARAGFTPPTPTRARRRRDHPRSRGVYAGYPFDRMVSSGSSPLARGLLLHHPRHDQERGIIPARAGFTRPSRP